MPQSTIILKVGCPTQPLQFEFSVIGEKSGLHPGEVIVSDQTVIFKPDQPFATSEQVRVDVKADLPGWETPLTYAFTTHEPDQFDPDILLKVSDDLKLDKNLRDRPPAPRNRESEVTVINGVSVPSDFPFFEPIIMEDGISDGRIFLNNWIGTPYIMIFENDGTPYFYQRVEDRARDFKVQPTGIMTRRHIPLGGFVGMDSSYTMTDLYQCVNGYGTDEHELHMTIDGHYFLIALGQRQVDMSQLIPGGNPNATVVDNHIQEFDENQNLVFEWLSYEHFDILDAVHENLQSGFIDYVHMNSIAIDYDGHIITSSRHLSEVTKIHRETGDIIWRLGGENNQFAFINDAYGLSYQHDARPVEGHPGRYTIFDNGNYHGPSFSRAVEFELDTDNMIATKVWEYRHTPDRFTWWMGNAQRLANGNTFINYADGSLPKAVEVTPEGEIVYEGDFTDYTHCYRAFRFEWDSPAPRPYLIVESFPDRVSLIFNKFGDLTVESYNVYAGLSDTELVLFANTTDPFLDLTSGLANGGHYFFSVVAVHEDGTTSQPSNMVDVTVNFVSPGDNYVRNGNFSDGTDHWDLGVFEDAVASAGVNVDGEYEINIENGGAEIWHVQLTQTDIPLIQGRTYRFEFDAHAQADRLIGAWLERNGDPWDNYSQNGQSIVRPQPQHYVIEFEMEHPTDYAARIVVNCGESNFDVFLDNFSLIEVQLGIEDDMTRSVGFELIGNFPKPI